MKKDKHDSLGKEMKVSEVGAVGLLLEKDLKSLLEIIQYRQSLWLLKALSRHSVEEEAEARYDLWLHVHHSSTKEKITKRNLNK